MCVCVRVCACVHVRARVCACVHVCVHVPEYLENREAVIVIVVNIMIQRTPVNLIGLVQDKNIIISGLSYYPVTIYY